VTAVMCERCRRADAVVVMSHPSRCGLRDKRLCDACSRSPDLPSPFTIRPLRPAPDPKK